VAKSALLKPKNKMDDLPPSHFDLQEWKRFYSNTDRIRPTAVEYFWKKYDPKGYTMYRITYKYNDELALHFQSSNLIGGFYQRLERLLKYAFGSMCVFGEPKDSIISGMFIIRGQEIPDIVKECVDFDSYDFVEVDTKDQAVQEEWNTYLAWDGKVAGKTFSCGKIFK
jgi:elongation factor 1-gamma